MRKTKMINRELIIGTVNASNQINDVLNNLVPLITSKLDGQFIGATTHRASIKIDKEIKALLTDIVPSGIRCVVLYERGEVYVRVGATVSVSRPGNTDLTHVIHTDHKLCNIDTTTRMASVQNMPPFIPYPKIFTATVLTEFDGLKEMEYKLEYYTSTIAAKKSRLEHFISEKWSC